MCASQIWRLKPTLTLPPEWKDLIHEIMKIEGFNNYASYITDLIRKDLKRRGMIRDSE